MEKETFSCTDCGAETDNRTMTCDSCESLVNEDCEEETREQPASKKVAVLKLYAGMRPARCGGGRLYLCHVDMYLRCAGAGFDTAEEAVDFLKRCLQSFHAEQGLILDECHVKLDNTTSIRLSIAQLLSEKGGNLAAFLQVKPRAEVPLEFEKIPDEAIERTEETNRSDKFEARVLGPLRNKIHSTEKLCWKFGLPAHNGLDCWGMKDFKKACQNPAALKPFMNCLIAHIKFDMVSSEFAGTIEEWKPDKTNECGVWAAAKLNYLKKVMK